MADGNITVTVDPVMVAMAQALAAIDAELGLPEDGCNSTQRTLDAVRKLKAEATKSERRAITFGDIVHTQVLAMRAAEDRLHGDVEAAVAGAERTDLHRPTFQQSARRVSSQPQPSSPLSVMAPGSGRRSMSAGSSAAGSRGRGMSLVVRRTVGGTRRGGIRTRPVGRSGRTGRGRRRNLWHLWHQWQGGVLPAGS